MVDDKDNHVDDTPDKAAWEMPLLLLGAFRTLVERAHDQLAEQGFADARPAHGFALQAVGSGAGVVDVARRLGVSKQAAAKTVAALERDGWVSRETDAGDARRAVIRLTERGEAFLDASVDAFAGVLADWGKRVGHAEIGRLRSTLAALEVGEGIRLDLGTWSSRLEP